MDTNYAVWIICIIGGLALSFCLYKMWECTILLKRNKEVEAYRLELLDKIDKANQRDITAGLGYDSHRYDMFDDVPYDTQLNNWRKPIESFFDEEKILAPKEFKN